MESSTNPKLILLFSGKRKSGKDYITDLLFSKLDPNQTVIIKISAPIKSFWSKSHNLELDHLLSSSPFKEQHRREMIRWSEDQRRKDPGIFCSQAVQMYEAFEKPVWIVSDIRRKTDILWFQETYPNKIKNIRIETSENTRKKRGWTFTTGVDDEPSECDLDNYDKWDMTLVNDDNDERLKELDAFLDTLINLVYKAIQS